MIHEGLGLQVLLCGIRACFQQGEEMVARPSEGMSFPASMARWKRQGIPTSIDVYTTPEVWMSVEIRSHHWHQ